MEKNKKYLYFSVVFEKELKKWLKENNAQKKVFAIELGVNANMISRYLQGNTFPTKDTYKKMADMFGIEKEKFTNPSEEYTFDYIKKTLQEDTPAPIVLTLPYKAIKYGDIIYITYPDNTEIQISEKEYNSLRNKISSYCDFLFNEIKHQK